MQKRKSRNRIVHALQVQKNIGIISAKQYKVYTELLQEVTYNDLFLSINDNRYSILQSIFFVVDNYYANLSRFFSLISVACSLIALICIHIPILPIVMLSLGIFVQIYGLIQKNWNTKEELRKTLKQEGKISHQQLLQEESIEELSPAEEELQHIYEQLSVYKATSKTEDLQEQILEVFHLLQEQKKKQKQIAEEEALDKLENDIKGVKNYISYKNSLNQPSITKQISEVPENPYKLETNEVEQYEKQNS